MVVEVKLQALIVLGLSWMLQKVSAFSLFALTVKAPHPHVKSCACAANGVRLLIHRQEELAF
jgi:hypothetical protein